MASLKEKATTGKYPKSRRADMRKEDEFWLELSDKEEMLNEARRVERKRKPEGFKERRITRKKKRERLTERSEQ